jgi:CelD/BcsL family acetyltransferase involved in cellulose biosynthesis
VLEVRKGGGQPIGWMPMMLQGTGRRRALRFIGANLADHLHPLAGDLDAESEVAAAMGSELGDDFLAWSTVVLDNVDVDARWLHALRESAPMRLASAVSRRSELPSIALPSSWDEYLASRSRNFRSEVGRKLRRLEREHDVRFRRSEDPEQLRTDIETLFRLHGARWEGRGGSSSDTPRARAFHHEFSARAFERGWLRLWIMEVDGEPVAAWYGWRIGERYAYYLAGFSPRWGDSSVGFILLAHTVRAAIEERASEYDMLLGQETYKRRFATRSRPVETVVLTRLHDPVRLLSSAEVPIRRMYGRLRPSVRDRLRSVASAVAGRLPSSRRR